ncbi:hypothetical protein ACA910_007196 [Epithemia clementina (nom. ined.)]
MAGCVGRATAAFSMIRNRMAASSPPRPTPSLMIPYSTIQRLVSSSSLSCTTRHGRQYAILGPHHRRILLQRNVEQHAAWNQNHQPWPRSTTRSTRLSFASSSSTDNENQEDDNVDDDDDLSKLRAGEMKRELESYGIDTKPFLEKSELLQALRQARRDGLPKPQIMKDEEQQAQQPPQQDSNNDTDQNDFETETTTTTATSSSSSTTDEVPWSRSSRQERIEQEMVACQGMKAFELKQELKQRGVSTTALLEKWELVNALAEARVDGIQRKEDDYDDYDEVMPKYTDVEVLTDDQSGPQKRSSQQQSSPFGGASSSASSSVSNNPFPGGIPGMGSFGNMFEQLRSGRATEVNPSGNGDGDGSDRPPKAISEKVQALMKNPKVVELVMKAQSNPRLAAMLQECIRNPAAGMAKYGNDPSMLVLMEELKKYV